MTDERDLHDPALDAAWRAQSTEMPPPPLDAAILAAAHRAVKSAPEKIGPGREATRPCRWRTPLAAAAVIGVIAIGALQLLPQEPDPTKVVVSDMPSTGAKSAAPAAPQVASSTQPPPSPPPPQSARAMTQADPSPPKVAAPAAAQNPLRSRASPAESAPRQERAMAAPPSAAPAEASSDFASREEQVVGATRPAPDPFPARGDAAAPAPAPSPAPAVAASAASPAESRATGRAGLTANAVPAAPRASPAQSSASAAGAVAPKLDRRAVLDEMQRQGSPDDFVARIRSLFAEANMAEAQRELLAFRAAYADADARLPADLRPWAATVPRN
ncbi:MAG: hypothetical protein ABW276_03545 [Casimicrobiaceae bacterium]